MRARTPCQNTTAPKTQTTSPTTPHFQRFSPKWSAIWAPHRLKSRPRRHQSGELHYTSLRHAARRLRVVQTPATAGVEGTGGAGGHGRLRDAGQAATPVGGRQGLAGLRGYAPSEARGADGSRAGRRPRAHKAARPGTTARGPLHPLRGATPDQKGCTAYGSGAAPRITRTNAESARRPPTISQASSMIGPKATTATKAHNVWTRGYDTAPGACIKQRPPRGIHYQW